MDIAIEFPVGVKTIRANHASQLNNVLNKAVEGFSIKVLDQGNTDAPFRLTLNSIDGSTPDLERSASYEERGVW